MQTFSLYPPYGVAGPRPVNKNFESQYRDYTHWQWPNFQHSVPSLNSSQGNNAVPSNSNFRDLLDDRGTPMGPLPPVLPSVPVPSRIQALPGEKTESAGEKDISEWDQLDNAGAAFLGPQLWEKTVPCDSELKFECMDLDEFLNENEIDEELLKRNLPEGDSAGSAPLPTLDSPNDLSQLTPSLNSSTTQPFLSESPPVSEQTGSSPSQDALLGSDSVASSTSSSESPQTPESPLPADDERHLAASDPSRSGRGKHSRKSWATGGRHSPSAFEHEGKRPRRPKREKCLPTSEISFSPTDFMLASVSGENFDPRTRSFSEDELKPQPMVKKSRKQQYVPNELKDERYWARRRKNNMAAKRSRDARRTKENQIAMRANFLEKENQNLRMELDKTRSILETMKERLSAYEPLSA